MVTDLTGLDAETLRRLEPLSWQEATIAGAHSLHLAVLPWAVASQLWVAKNCMAECPRPSFHARAAPYSLQGPFLLPLTAALAMLITCLSACCSPC